DRNRQRIRDHEAADEQRDTAEREQEVLEDGEEAVRVVGLLLRLRLCRAHLCARWQERRDLAHELARRGAMRRGDLDRGGAGAPPREITLPSCPTSCARSAIPPDASATPGSARTRVSSEAGSEGGVSRSLPCSSPPIALLPVITASVLR